MMTGACCPKGDGSATQLRFADGHTVGIMGLKLVFQQLLAMGRAPDQVTDTELLEMVRALKNYISAKASIEADYAAALRHEYAIFYAGHVKR